MFRCYFILCFKFNQDTINQTLFVFKSREIQGYRRSAPRCLSVVILGDLTSLVSRIRSFGQSMLNSSDIMLLHVHTVHDDVTLGSMKTQ